MSKPQAGIAPISDGATSDAIGFAEPAHVDSIDLERDSAIRVQALMALAAYSVLHSSCKHGSALAKSQPSAIRVLGTHGSRCSLGSPVS